MEKEKQVSKKVAAIICAAGPGTRFGGKRKKQFVEVAGRPVFLRSIELFSDRDEVKQILLGIAKEDEETVKITWGAKLSFFHVKTFVGGQERFDTIRKALELLKEDIELVAVHDACRCCATAQLVTDTIAKAAETGAAIPAAPVTATIKQVKDGMIIRTVDRSDLYEAQTPQVFETSLLKKGVRESGQARQGRRHRRCVPRRGPGAQGRYCRIGFLQPQDHPAERHRHCRGDPQVAT